MGEYKPAGHPECTAPLGAFAPAIGSRWVDKHHDTWTMGSDGLMHTFETAPFPPEHVQKKWGPLIPAKEVAVDPEEQGLSSGMDIVWVRNADMHRKGAMALEKMRRAGMLDTYPGPRVVGPRRMTWYAMPRWVAEDYVLRPHYDDPFEEPARD